MLHCEIARMVIVDEVVCSLPEFLAEFELRHIRIALPVFGEIVQKPTLHI